MARYDSARQLAERLIAKDGEVAELKVLTAVAGANAWDTGVPTEQVQAVRMVFLNFPSIGNSGNSGERYFENSLIQGGDKKVLLAAKGLDFPPDLNALVTRADGSIWKIVQFKNLDPNGQQIIYTLQVRQ